MNEEEFKMSKRLINKIYNKRFPSITEVHILIYKNNTLLFPENLDYRDKYILEFYINIIVKIYLKKLNSYIYLKDRYGITHVEEDDDVLEKIKNVILKFNIPYEDFNNITLKFVNNYIDNNYIDNNYIDNINI